MLRFGESRASFMWISNMGNFGRASILEIFFWWLTLLIKFSFSLTFSDVFLLLCHFFKTIYWTVSKKRSTSWYLISFSVTHNFVASLSEFLFWKVTQPFTTQNWERDRIWRQLFATISTKLRILGHVITREGPRF